MLRSYHFPAKRSFIADGGGPASTSASAYRKSLPITTFVCRSGTAVVGRAGGRGVVTSVVLTIPSMKAKTTYTVFTNPHHVLVQLSDIANNPVSWFGGAIPS